MAAPASRSLLFVFAACASPTEAELERTITNGAPAADEGVVGLVGEGTIYCSGVLIAPRIVLTAAHCLSATTVDGVAFGSAHVSAQIVDVAYARVHPDFDPTYLANDLGLVVLAAAAPAAPLPRLEPPLAPGQLVQLVGFGKTSATDAAPAAKHRGTARLTALTAETFDVVAAPSLSCAGDSGGAVLVALDGVAYLVGIVSAGDVDCQQFGRGVRVDPYRAFLDDFVARTDVGTASPGERCYYAEHCARGECWFPADAPTIGYCATACATDADCDRATDCIEQRCRYAEPSPGALGTACETYSDCDSRSCTRGTCSSPFPSEPDGGCASSRPGSALLVLLLILGLRPRKALAGPQERAGSARIERSRTGTSVAGRTCRCLVRSSSRSRSRSWNPCRAAPWRSARRSSRRRATTCSPSTPLTSRSTS